MLDLIDKRQSQRRRKPQKVENGRLEAMTDDRASGRRSVKRPFDKSTIRVDNEH